MGGGWFEKKEGAHRPGAAALPYFKIDRKFCSEKVPRKFFNEINSLYAIGPLVTNRPPAKCDRSKTLAYSAQRFQALSCLGANAKSAHFIDVTNDETIGNSQFFEG
jgi:hypothetical protein